MTPDPAALRVAIEHDLPAALGLLREWVGINSHTSNPHGVNALAHATADAFTPLGFTAESVPCSGENCGNHLFLRRPGRSRHWLLCVSHLDTVFSAEEEHRNHFHWREAEGRIYGPGTVDIKGGTALLWLKLRALRAAAPALFDHFGWAVGLNAAEETLGDDFAQLALARFGDRAAAALVYEAGACVDNAFTFVVARKGRSLFRVAAAGRGAHAGSRHNEGANAITELGRLIPLLASLTNSARGLTANIGFVRGGEGLNRVAQHAELEGELRAYDPAALAEAEAAILALAGPGTVAAVSDGFRCQVHTEVSGRTSAWPENPGTRSLLDTYARAAARVGYHVVSEQRGGLSDGNFLAPFLPTIDGLGPDGGNAHASEWSDDPAAPKRPEYLVPSSIVPKTLLNTLAVAELAAALG